MKTNHSFKFAVVAAIAIFWLVISLTIIAEPRTGSAYSQNRLNDCCKIYLPFVSNTRVVIRRGLDVVNYHYPQGTAYKTLGEIVDETGAPLYNARVKYQVCAASGSDCEAIKTASTALTKTEIGQPNPFVIFWSEPNNIHYRVDLLGVEWETHAVEEYQPLTVITHEVGQYGGVFGVVITGTLYNQQPVAIRDPHLVATVYNSDTKAVDVLEWYTTTVIAAGDAISFTGTFFTWAGPGFFNGYYLIQAQGTQEGTP